MEPKFLISIYKSVFISMNLPILYVYNNYLSISIQGRVVGVVGASGGTKIFNINI